MAEIKYTDQLLYTGQGYLDKKMQPVNTFNDLLKIPRAQRFVGMEVTVKSDENNGGVQAEYWLEGGTANSNWKLKDLTGIEQGGSSNIKIEGDDVEI